MPEAVRARIEDLTIGRSLKIDCHHRTSDGRVIDIGLTASTLTLPEGGTGYMWSFQDVTDVRRMERDARLRQRLAAVGEMAAGIAHEIRNPLASMSGSIQVLRQELPLSEDQAQLMDIVLRESERLNDTIDRSSPMQTAAVGDGETRREEGAAGHRALAAEQRGDASATTSSTSTCRPSPYGARLTKTRSGRSSGTWRPMGTRDGKRRASPHDRHPGT